MFQILFNQFFNLNNYKEFNCNILLLNILNIYKNLINIYLTFYNISITIML
jgi:hypothetical protein